MHSTFLINIQCGWLSLNFYFNFFNSILKCTRIWNRDHCYPIPRGQDSWGNCTRRRRRFIRWKSWRFIHVLPRLDFIYMPELHNISFVTGDQVFYDDRLKSEGSLVRLPLETYILILNFGLFPVPHSSATPIQMESSVAFFQSNRCIEIDILLKRMAAINMTALQL